MYNNLLSVFLLGQGQGGGIVEQILPIALIVVVFYFFMIRPQLKKQKEQKQFREGLAKGDKVTTIGGLHGKINDVKDDVVMIEVAPNMILKVEKAAVSAAFDSTETANLKAK